MITLEEMAQSENAHATRVAAAAAEAPQSHEKLDLAQVEQDLFDFFSKISGSIPDWVPVVAPFLKAKKEQWSASAAARGKNLATGEKIADKSEALKLFVEKTLSGLWQEGRTVIDLLLIFGTGGSGNLAVGAEKIAAKQVGKMTLESLSAQIAKLAAGGEGAAFDLLPGFFKGLASKLAKHPEQAGHLLEMAKVFEKIQKIPGARPFMESMLAKQEWWQKLKTELQSSQGRADHGKAIFSSVSKTGFNFQSAAV
jgi:hypothetical protein